MIWEKTNFIFGELNFNHFNKFKALIPTYQISLLFCFHYFFFTFASFQIFVLSTFIFIWHTTTHNTHNTHNVCSLLYFEFTTNWYYINKNILNTLCLRWVLVLSMIWFSLFSSNFCFVILFVLQNEITYYHQTYTHTHSA